MLLIIIAFLVNVLIETSVSFSVEVPGDPIEARIGSTVILPCWISPPENAEALEIRWYRHDQFNNPVLLYNHGKIQDIQEESYRHRSSLTRRSDQSGGLKDGDVSLRLENLRVQDEGSFRCYVSGDSSYGSEEMLLKITAVGSTPVLVPKPLDDGHVNISCRSSGWYPKPSITWSSADERVLRPGGSSHSRGEDEMFSVHSWTVISLSDAQLVSCSLSIRTGEFKESRIDVQAVISTDSSGLWKALFFTFLVFALLGLVGLIFYKDRKKKTGKKPVKEVVGDKSVEKWRKHAVTITIDPERSHPDLKVKDCKMMRDSARYHHTGDGFPYELCAFGAQRFTSGLHYWEVELAQRCTPPKNYWLIGVAKDGSFTSRKRSALTPSAGFWFLCSDGPNGFYTNTDPPVKLSLTPRPERLGVLLDYDEGQLSFYNVTESKHLLTISSRFSGPVVPLFNPGVGDQGVLKILDCPEPVESAVEFNQPLLNNSSDAYMLSIIVVLLNLFIETSVSFSVEVPGDPIEARIGSTVILPCWISPPENAEALEIRWYRHEQFNNPVLLYNHGKIQDIQEESYRNRSSLTRRSDQSGGLKDGDVSLRLKKLRVQDEGSFHCYVSGDSSYGSEEMLLKIRAVGSTPVLVPKPLDDGHVNISCRSSGWYPKPSITWSSADERVLRPGGSSHSRGEDEMFSVHSWTVISLSDAQLVSCSLSIRTGEFKESRIGVQAVISTDSSGPWKALFLTFLVFALLGLVGLILYKYRHKLTDSKDEMTTKTENHKVVGDINLEHLRKHAVTITIDPEHSHSDLKVKDCKMMRDGPNYSPSGDGFPYELCAFGAQRFTSGLHYWEVELAQRGISPKNYWLIGVAKDGSFPSRERSALTPSAGFWFLCSDGPNGFYTNTDPPVKLSLTPRPERLGVLFDYDDGQLSFYNVTESKHLLTISSRFSGPVVPLFNPGVGDQGVLEILDCPEPVESAVDSSQPLLNNSSDA
ncbi:uncharacterized protein LOC122349120 [Puntigrus tetrazona]|uniref:uncharacterized protein LOC122349120 n=1 Tax=Puntigrus tetrazona TaxID=1606681 RepID=UPI001C8A83EB|nr:uncharacterized protein LOC122349120 [Puntigrus tetrazona]